MLHVSLLGPLEVRQDGALVRVPAGKTAEVLIRLALDAGSVVRTDRLIEDLWAHDSAVTSRNTVQSKIAKLRRAFGPVHMVVSRGDGYMLDIDPAEVDGLAVLQDAAEAGRLLGEGDDRAASALASSALSRFGGELLPSAAGDWVEAHRARLEQARLTLLETLFTARLRLGEVPGVIVDIEASVAAHPFQESLWELLMAALYRAGRQADALAAYQRVRRILSEQLGLEPGPSLRQFERQILAQDETLRDGGSTPAAALRSNLPALAVELVGRDDDVSTLLGMVGDERLVTLIGPGGVGKTALAIEAARRLRASASAPAGGIWLARLEDATTASEVADAVIAALGVPGGEPALLDRLRANPTLLVLDNCEHVVEHVADFVLRLFDGHSGAGMLCTSQTPLEVDGETIVEVRPLSLAHAVDLFGRRATTHGRRRAADDHSQVEHLCRSLDGLPLAIELAAARTRTLTITDITRRLDDRLDLLHDPASRRPERRRAIRSTIGWSYDLLFPDDQRGLWALSTFAGGAPLAAVEHVMEALDVPVSATIDVLGRLANRSLLIVDDETDSDSVRYRLLDSIRAFARDAMATAGVSDRACAAHARWFAAAAAASTDGVRSSAQQEFLAVARNERANIDAALTWSAGHDPRRALAIAVGFGWSWIVLGDSRGGERLLAALDAAGDGAPASDKATALLLTGWIEAATGDLDAARAHISRADVLAKSIADIDLRARSAYYLAYVVSHEGLWTDALELTELSASLYRALDRPWDQAANALFAARAANSAGDTTRAAAACAAVRRWLEQVDDPWLLVRGEAVYGEFARLEHRFDDAVIHLGSAVRTSARLGFRQAEAYQLSSLGRAECQAGDYPAGVATLELALAKAEAAGDVRLAALVRVHLGRVLRAVGNDRLAREILQAGVNWHRRVGGGEQAALGECLLAALDAAAGVAGTDEGLAVILDDARRRGDAPVEVFALDALARLRARAGEAIAATDLCDEADRRMAAASHFITDRDRVDAHVVRRGR